MKNPFSKKADTAGGHTHDGTPDCPACKQALALGKALAETVNTVGADMDGIDKVAIVTRVLALGIASEAKTGKVAEVTAIVMSDLAEQVGRVLMKMGRMETEGKAGVALAKALGKRHAIGFSGQADDDDDPVLAPTTTTKH